MASGKFDKNRAFEWWQTAADLVVLNLLFVITCIPIITIGTATCSMYTYLIRTIRGDERPLAKSYFKLFAENFKKTVGVWIGMLLAYGILYMDFQIGKNMAKPMNVVILAIVVLGVMLVTSVWIYYMSWTGLIENTVSETIKNALILGIQHAPYSLLMIVLWLSPAILLWMPEVLRVTIPLFFLVWPAIMAYMNAQILAKLYLPYLGEPPKDEPDNWSAEQ